MEKKKIRRSYILPVELAADWEKSHLSKKDYSPSAAGAFLVWMGLAPELRDAARRLAQQENLGDAITHITFLIRQWIIRDEIEMYQDQMTEEERAQVLADIQATKNKIGRKK